MSIPERPGPPLNPGVVDYERSKALLEWTKPLKDGGYPITHYKVSLYTTYDINDNIDVSVEIYVRCIICKHLNQDLLNKVSIPKRLYPINE